MKRSTRIGLGMWATGSALKVIDELRKNPKADLRKEIKREIRRSIITFSVLLILGSAILIIGIYLSMRDNF